MDSLTHLKITVIGLGYVGLPLAIEFSKKFKVVGFDLDSSRIDELNSGVDRTGEVDAAYISRNSQIAFTDNPKIISDSDIYIVAVPTPVDDNNKPNLSAITNATELVAQVLLPGNCVVYESTVYPGTTEEICLPILEEMSGLEVHKDMHVGTENIFYLGYSPERVNPGDPIRKIPDIVKVTAGSSCAALGLVDGLYSEIVEAGTFKAKSIKVAEAAKIIENTQRDVNIALVNELAIIFERLGVDTNDVLEAAETKWNFLPFKPGLVGGHCIGVDPYYLTYKAEEVGYEPEIILAGRKLNDAMALFVGDKILQLFKQKEIREQEASVLVMGVTFKENCPDIRNSKVFDLINYLSPRVRNIDVYDPLIERQRIDFHANVELVDTISPNTYDGIVIAVAHDQIRDLEASTILNFGKERCVVYDIKNVLPSAVVDGRL